jgi:hypothetical protein
MQNYIKQFTFAIILGGLSSQAGLAGDDKVDGGTKRRYSSVPMSLPIPYYAALPTALVEFQPLKPHAKRSRYETGSKNEVSAPEQYGIGVFSLLPSDSQGIIYTYPGVAKSLYSTCKYFRYLMQNGLILNEHGLSRVYFRPPNKKFINFITLERLGNVHTLDLSYTKVTDVSMLGNVHTLDLEGCEVKGLASLGNVHTLNLIETQVTDVSMLGNVHSLDLALCQGVTDVSALGKVHTLDLGGCLGVTDVSALGNVHTLNLIETQVTDVSALGNVHTLDLRSCQGVTDVSMLKHVQNLTLTKNSISEENLSQLRKVNSDIKIHFID